MRLTIIYIRTTYINVFYITGRATYLSSTSDLNERRDVKLDKMQSVCLGLQSSIKALS